MTHTLHPEIEKTIQRLVNRIKQDVVTWKEDDVYWLIIWYLWPYLLPPSQHLKDEPLPKHGDTRFNDNWEMETYVEPVEELKQSTPKIEKINIAYMEWCWEQTVWEEPIIVKKINEVIDYINNKD
jgi:hypothetical protein